MHRALLSPINPFFSYPYTTWSEQECTAGQD